MTTRPNPRSEQHWWVSALALILVACDNSPQTTTRSVELNDAMTAPTNDLGDNAQAGQGSTNMMGNVDSLADLGFGIGQSNANNTNQSMDLQNQEEDIFAGLDMGGEIQMSDIDFDFS